MAVRQDAPRTPDEEYLPDEQWEVYRSVIRAARRRGVQFGLGGAFGYASYTGDWRNTKDLDLFVVPKDRDAMIQVLLDEGLEDYYGQMRYDRRWIYRGYRDDTIVDLIWAMANQRAQVDQHWFDAARTTEIRGEPMLVIPPEELLWQKIYIVQRDRCDWPDVLNLIYALGPALDWAHLLRRMEDDWPLLGAVLSMYSWLCPARARELPRWLWERLRVPGAVDEDAPNLDPVRVCWLDSRPWLPTALIDPEKTPCPPW
jgi:hypothetical protein